ncbi:MAG: ArnT family glycosyltransferase [Acidimicrobiales bacterium]
MTGDRSGVVATPARGRLVGRYTEPPDVVAGQAIVAPERPVPATTPPEATTPGTTTPGTTPPGATTPEVAADRIAGGILDLPPLGRPDLDRRPLGAPPVAAWRRGSRWSRAWLARHRLSMAYLAPAMAVTGIVHGIGMTGYPAAVDDEGTYVAQAWSVALHHALTPYTYWYTHPPFGWIQIAGWGLLTDGFRPSLQAVAMGRQFMLVCFVVSAALVFVVARRLGMRRGWASAAVLLFGLSPLAVYYDRMAYLDNVAVPWLLAAFALALSPRRRLVAFAGSGVCFAGAVLSKETVLILAPALLWQAWQAANRKTRAFCVTALVTTFVLVVSTYPVYAALKGELLPGRRHVSLWSAITFQLAGRQGSGSVLGAASQAHYLVAGWLRLDPWLLGLGLVGLPVAFFVRRLRPVAAAYLIGVLVALRGGYLPVPYVVALLPFAGLEVAGVADALWSRAVAGTGRRHRWPPPSPWAERTSSARRWGGRIGVLAMVAAMVAAAGPTWATRDHEAMTSDRWGPLRRSEAWIEKHISHRDRLLVGDTMWVDLVDNGFHQKLGVVWYSKLGYVNNLDPSVTRRLPGGWRDFQYVVVTPSMRGALAIDPGQLHQVRGALSHSVAVKGFGRGIDRIVVRRISDRVHPAARRSADHGRRFARLDAARRRRPTAAVPTSAAIPGSAAGGSPTPISAPPAAATAPVPTGTGGPVAPARAGPPTGPPTQDRHRWWGGSGSGYGTWSSGSAPGSGPGRIGSAPRPTRAGPGEGGST